MSDSMQILQKYKYTHNYILAQKHMTTEILQMQKQKKMYTCFCLLL